MGALRDHFDILTTKEGSGWSAIYIRVRNWVTPREYSGKTMVCLSNEIINQEELDQHIDQLIQQLEQLRDRGRAALKAIQAVERLKKS